jgi:mRNA-decapping enzyme subunit 2
MIPEALVPGEEQPLSTYTLRRILHGIPEGQGEIIRETALPMESNMDIMNGIDFHKGCYVGQELTIRTHHTGVVRKRILPVQLYDMSDPPPEADVPMHSAETALVLPPLGSNISGVNARKGRSAGKWLGGIGNVGLALCRLEMMTDIVLTGESTQYSPGQEFKISWDTDGDIGEVKVRAFVPPWTRQFILGRGARSSRPVDEGEVQRARDMVEQLEEEVQRYQRPES